MLSLELSEGNTDGFTAEGAENAEKNQEKGRRCKKNK